MDKKAIIALFDCEVDRCGDIIPTVDMFDAEIEAKEEIWTNGWEENDVEI